MIWNAGGDLEGIIVVKSSNEFFDTADKTLIISSHGSHLGVNFEPPYNVVIEFATPDGGALVAGLKDVIDGKVTSSNISLGGKKQRDDYKLTHFEHDPTPEQVDGYVAGKKFDVLMFKSGAPAFTLSNIISILASIDMKYPGILCVFCRVSTSKPKFTYQGKKSSVAQQVNQHQINATAVALQIQSQKQSLRKVQN
jgi:hypothetical protein